MEHSPTSATGTGWEPTPWHATQRAALGGWPPGHGLPRHGLMESTLPLEQRGLSFSDQDIGVVAELLTLFYEAVRGVPHRLRPESYFHGQHRTAEEMCANVFGEVPTTPRTHVRATSAYHVCGEFCEAEGDVTGRALGDDVTRTVGEDQCSFFRCQDLRSLAINVRETAVGRLDGVGGRNRLGALRALHLHVAPHLRCRDLSRPRHPDQA